MKFSVKRNSLVEAIKEMMLAIPKKPAIAVTACIKFSAVDDKQFLLQATDSEVYLSDKLDVFEVVDPVEFVVDAVDLMNAVANIPEQPLTFEVKNETLTCKYHGGKFKIHCSEENAQFFPEWPRYNESEAMRSSIKCDIFQRASAEAQPFAAVGGVRPLMNGVAINFQGEYIDFVATDGHSLYKFRTIGHSENTDTIVIHSHVAGILSKLKGTSTTIDIAASGNNVFFAMGDITLVARRIDGRYPAYDRVIPADSDIVAEFTTADMISAIKRVSPMAETVSRMVKLFIDSDKITVESSDELNGKHADEEVKATCNGSMKVGYKVDLLLNCLSLLGETATMQFVDNTRPCKFTHKTDNGVITTIVMPMIINT